MTLTIFITEERPVGMNVKVDVAIHRTGYDQATPDEKAFCDKACGAIERLASELSGWKADGSEKIEVERN